METEIMNHMKKIVVFGIILGMIVSALVPSIQSQLGISEGQISEKQHNDYGERGTLTQPVLNGRLEDVYLSHGKRIYYGNPTYQNASEDLYVIDNTTIDATYVWIAIVLNPHFVDNTYGNGTVPQYRNVNGNPCGHNFQDLNTSDRQEIKLYASTHTLVFYASLDVIHRVLTAPSGFGIPAWGNGESQVYVGNPNLVTYNTSTCFNVNYYYNTPPYNVLSDSPTLGDQNYTLYPGYQEWEHRIIYELRVDRSVFEGGTMNISATEMPNMHASPNKIGPHTIILTPIYGSLGNYIWEDNDKDGAQDAGEPGLSNVPVLLHYYYKGSNATVIGSTTTNTAGQYMFNYLPPGQYYLTFTPPPGYRFSTPDQTSDAYDSDANPATGDTVTISLSPDEDDMTWDAGMYLKEFTLMLVIEGSGTVEKYPNQSWYTYGQVVTLTANPTIGWQFDHWAGDLSGSDNPTTITMNANKTVVANFTVIHYTLTVTTQGQGSVTKNPNQPWYTYGQVVSLTANPALGWSFNHWAGDISGSTNPTTITITGHTFVIANFSQNVYMLTIAVNPTAGGSVAAAPSPPYHYGDIVTLTAAANTGYTFDHWSGDASGSSTVTTVTMTGNKSVTAHFTLSVYTLTITVEPAAGGSVTADPGPPYNYNDVVTLTATANPGYTFDHWSGDASGESPVTTVTMNGNKTVTAHFTQNSYRLTITIDGQGTVEKDPDQTDYTYGTLVELTAVAEVGWIFTHWSGDLNGTDNPGILNMTSDKAVTAHFTLRHYTLTIHIQGNGTVIKDPDQQTYPFGTLVELTCIAEPGWLFHHWSGDISGNNNPTAIRIDANKTVTAHVSRDSTPPSVQLIKPERALYILNYMIRPYVLPRKPVIIGPIDIVVNAADNLSGIQKVEFYIDGTLKTTINNEPYQWTWEDRVFFRHTIKVVAYDFAGNTAFDEIKVWKFF